MDPKKEILSISRRAENATCVDCRMGQPTWASFNLGIFMCMTCAGHHRSLGTHITRVRSVTMDNWDPASVALMASMGNIRGNSYWEANLPPHHRLHPGVDDRQRADFIRSKYVNRAYYGEPKGDVQTTAAGGAATEARPLSKMEQRQARLQARQQQAVVSATPPPQSTSVPQPTSNLRQSSVPVSSSAAMMGGTAASLFSGMAISTTSTAAATTAAPTAAAAPAPAKLVKAHSASPWVTRSEHQQYQQAPVQTVPQVQAPVPVAAASSVNLLDFSVPSDQQPPPAATTAAVDDMFAGLSVSSEAPVAATNAPAAANELLSFYSNEPASAPARAQHSPMPSPAESFMVAQPQVPVPATTHSQSDADIFSFIQPASVDAPAPSFSNVLAAPPAAVANTSSFSFLADDAATVSAPPATNGAFSFMAGGDASVPDMNTLIVMPDSYAGMDAMTMQPGFGVMQPIGVNGHAAPINFPTQTLTHSVSQPLQGHVPHYPAPVGMPGQYGYQPSQAYAPQAAYPHQPYMHGVPAGGMPTLAPLPPFPSAMQAAPAMPQFMVQSVQATQRAQAQLATEIANDPFGHLHLSAATAPLQSLSGGASTQQAAAPKQPHECDAEGCTGKKVSRGLCTYHIRLESTSGAARATNTAPASGPAFNFLEPAPTATKEVTVTEEPSGFSFLGDSEPTTTAQASSFAFL